MKSQRYICSIRLINIHGQDANMYAPESADLLETNTLQFW